MNDITAEGLSPLYETLSHTKIKHLDLSKNPLKNKGIKIVGQMLSKGGLVLENLYLQDC